MIGCGRGVSSPHCHLLPLVPIKPPSLLSDTVPSYGIHDGRCSSRRTRAGPSRPVCLRRIQWRRNGVHLSHSQRRRTNDFGNRQFRRQWDTSSFQGHEGKTAWVSRHARGGRYLEEVLCGSLIPSAHNDTRTVNLESLVLLWQPQARSCTYALHVKGNYITRMLQLRLSQPKAKSPTSSERLLEGD